MSRIDLVIFGATGFTGKHAAEKMVSFAKKYPVLSWAVAGRSEKKLQSLLLEISKKTDEDLSNVKVIIAHVDDELSLKEMCEQAKVIVNCVGPYRLYGEPVVRAAIEAKAHYVDVNGETQFMERMQLQYGERARDAGLYVVSACGFDSIPNDMGVVFLKQHFRGTLNSVESYLSTSIAPELRSEATKTGVIHYGTWESLIYGIGNSHEREPLKRQLYPTRMPTFKPKLQKRAAIHKPEKVWCVPFAGADASVVYRSQRYFYEQCDQRPVQFKPYVEVSGLLYTLVFASMASLIFLLSKFRLTRGLLLRHPRLFSLGAVTREGPSREVMEGTRFSFTLYGEGWDQRTDVETAPPNKKLVARVSGSNPGYGATVVALLLSAITILKEQDKMPSTGGVMTTAIAFHNTTLIDKLNDNNLTFEIIDPTPTNK